MKKLLSLALVCLMLLTLFAACTPTTSPTPSVSAPATPTSSKPADTTTPPPPTNQKPEKAEIVVEIFDRGTDGGKTDCTNNVYTDWIKAKILEDENIVVTFKAVSRWEEVEQLNNLMAAGSAPDICVTYDAGLVANYRDLGGLTDLAPYIDTTLADFKAFLGADPSIAGRDLIQRNMNTDTGEIFSVPAKRMNSAGVNTFIRKDWLDKLGLPLPTTTEEFYNALVAFKEQDPGGVGKDKVIPFTMTTDVRWRADTILESFIDPNLTDKDRWINTVVDRYFLLPGYKEGFRYLNKMYNDGLIDPEFPLYKDDTASDNLIKQGVVGAFVHNWDQAYRDTPGLLRDLKVNVPDAEIVTIDPFKNAAGKTMKNKYDVAGLNIFIPTTCKNVDAALRYINWMSKTENYNYLQTGELGITHNLVDGLPKIIPASDPRYIMNSNQNIDYTIIMNGLFLGDEATTIKALANGYTVAPSLITAAYENAMRDAKSNPVVPATLSAAGPYSQTLIDKGLVLMAESVTAKPADFDKVWDAAIADWLASGAQEIIDERAAKYIAP